MILSFGTVNIKVDKFESYEALDDALALCEAGSMYAGQKRGTENAWNMIAVTNTFARTVTSRSLPSFSTDSITASLSGMVYSR